MQEKNTVTIVILVVVALALILGGFFYYRTRTKSVELQGTPTSTQEAVDQGVSQESKEITLTSPRTNERVGSPIVVAGETTLVVPTIYYRLTTTSGKEIANGFAKVEKANPVAQKGIFRGELTYYVEKGDKGNLDVFVKNADGSERIILRVPLFYTTTPEFIKG